MAFVVSRVVEALFRISRRIESTNTHLDEIKTELAEVAQTLSTSLINLDNMQNRLEDRVDNLEDMSDQTNDRDDFDQFYEKAVEIITESESASASLLQRRLQIGYARAARLLDHLEQKGHVGPADGAKPRQILK